MLEFTALLRLERKRGGRAGQKPAHANGFTGFVAITVVTGIDALNGLLDLLEQLALAVTGAQFQGVFFFNRGAVRRIGDHHGVFAQMLGGFAGIAQHFMNKKKKENEQTAPAVTPVTLPNFNVDVNTGRNV